MDENLKCAPSKIYNKKIGTCFTNEQLVLMATAYNKYIEKNKINNTKINLNAPNKELLSELTRRLSKQCNTQTCLLQEQFVKEINDSKTLFELLYNSYRPVGPFKGKEKHKWLNTSDINQILFQYKNTHPDFVYFGALPIDFESIHIPINISKDKLYYWLVKLYKANIHKLGFVLNLSKHNEPGTHWVALYFNIKKSQIYYFDSTAEPPPGNIINLMNRIASFCYSVNIIKSNDIKNINKNKFVRFTGVDVQYNRMQHQRGNSECGVYSTNFIINMINDVPFNKFTSTIITDAEVNKLRSVFFRHR